MEDDRIWEFERSLWVGGAERYHELIDDACVMVLPQPPFVLTGQAAMDQVSRTPKWEDVTFTEQQVSRPQEGLIVIGYHAQTQRKGSDDYAAYCTTTIRRLSHEVWRVVQHQQTPPISSADA